LIATTSSTASPCARQLGQERPRARPERQRRIVGGQERRQLAGQAVGVRERRALAPRIDQEVERVDRAHVDGELDLHVELGLARADLEGQPREVVAVRIALPVQLVLAADRQLVALDADLDVIARPQPDHVRSQRGRLRIAIPAAMADQEAHRPKACLTGGRGRKP
jgi:hypothetical protein